MYHFPFARIWKGAHVFEVHVFEARGLFTPATGAFWTVTAVTVNRMCRLSQVIAPSGLKTKA